MKNEVNKTYEANGQDCFNYAARYGTSNVQLQGVIEFDSFIDSGTLEKAVRLSIDVEPILGCTFVEDDKKAYWERIKNIDEVTWYTYEKCEDKDNAIQKFLREPLGLNGQQQVKVKLINSSSESTICIKINHACSDAGGVKQYLLLLSKLYTALCNNLDYKPCLPVCRRDSRGYFESLGISEPLSLFDPSAVQKQPTWAFLYNGLELAEMHIDVVEFPEKLFREIKLFSKKKEVTINTIILTAFYRTMFKMIMPEARDEMEVYVTTDLRKHIKDKDKLSICNLSSMMNARLCRINGESFEETLERTHKMMSDLKTDEGGLNTAITMEVLGAIDFSKCLDILQSARDKIIENRKNTPLLSNIGIIPTLRFGELEARDAYVVTPSMYAPGFMLGVSSYKDALKLVVSYYEPSTSKDDVKKLLCGIKEEIVSSILI